MKPKKQTNISYKLVVIGVSAGALTALKVILGGLPVHFSLPVIIVQHRKESDTGKLLIDLLQKNCSLKVIEIEDKMFIQSGNVYVAPSGYHSLTEEDHFALSTEEPVNYSLPSIDLLFESAVHYYGEKIIGIILTGANHDGAKGLAAIKNAGGLAVVQNPETAECAVMPQAAIKATKVDHVIDLNEIAQLLIKIDDNLTVSDT